MDGMGVGGMVLQSERLVQMRRYYTKKGAHSSPEIQVCRNNSTREGSQQFSYSSCTLAISKKSPCIIHLHSDTYFVLSFLYALQVSIEKPKEPHFSALQDWKAMFVTHVHCCFSHLFCPLYHFLIHSPPAAMFLSKWETIQLISSLRKKKTLGNLAFIFSFSFFFFCLFLLNNTVSCYLRAAADNMYFNFCS